MGQEVIRDSFFSLAKGLPHTLSPSAKPERRPAVSVVITSRVLVISPQGLSTNLNFGKLWRTKTLLGTPQ